MPERSRRFPPPWSVEEHDVCFIVRDNTHRMLAYVYFEEEPGRRAADIRRSAGIVSPCYRMGDGVLIWPSPSITGSRNNTGPPAFTRRHRGTTGGMYERRQILGRAATRR
jgi:hypothetical protein